MTAKAIRFVDCVDRAEWHDVEAALARLFHDKISSTLHNIGLSRAVRLVLCRDKHALIYFKLVFTFVILHMLNDRHCIRTSNKNLEHFQVRRISNIQVVS